MLLFHLSCVTMWSVIMWSITMWSVIMWSVIMWSIIMWSKQIQKQFTTQSNSLLKIHQLNGQSFSVVQDMFSSTLVLVSICPQSVMGEGPVHLWLDYPRHTFIPGADRALNLVPLSVPPAWRSSSASHSFEPLQCLQQPNQSNTHTHQNKNQLRKVPL